MRFECSRRHGPFAERMWFAQLAELLEHWRVVHGQDFTEGRNG